MGQVLVLELISPVFYLSLDLYIHHFIRNYPFNHHFIYPSTYTSIILSQTIHSIIILSIPRPIYIHHFISNYPFNHHFIYPSTYTSIILSQTIHSIIILSCFPIINLFFYLFIKDSSKYIYVSIYCRGM